MRQKITYNITRLTNNINANRLFGTTTYLLKQFDSSSIAPFPYGKQNSKFMHNSTFVIRSGVYENFCERQLIYQLSGLATEASHAVQYMYTIIKKICTGYYYITGES